MVAGPAARTRTASGSRAVAGTRARVARGSRIWVEGRHDAELVEHVWGDDLRVEGVETTAGFALDLLAHPDVIAGKVHTRWVEEEFIDDWAAAQAADAGGAS